MCAASSASPDMDHRQLGFLVALARERHFGRAATACNVTQPTLSARLKQLEEELGCALIIRGHRFEGLTPEGEHVLSHARRILASLDELNAELDPSSPPSGLLRLGLIPSALDAVSSWVVPLREHYPALTLRLMERATLPLMQSLMEGDIDVAVGYLDVPAAEPFVARRLHTERYALLAREDCFTLPERPAWADIGNFPLCLLTPDMQHRHRIDLHARREGVTLSPVLETESMAALERLVGQGAGVGIVEQHGPEVLRHSGLVHRLLPATGEDPPVGLLWRAGAPPSRRLQALLEWLREPGEAPM
ncbi:LysR family transcriptional regulator [Kushneria marisflavi]|nr:LysR family transcriptional regulator [Kushneria marisflavi]